MVAVKAKMRVMAGANQLVADFNQTEALIKQKRCFDSALARCSGCFLNPMWRLSAVQWAGGNIVKLTLLALLVSVLSSCALLDPAYEKPSVHLVKIEALSSHGLEQRFRVDLKIINPNRSGLSVSGMSYTLKLNGEKVIKGVSGQISAIPAYAERTVQVEASTNIFAGLKLIASVLKNPEQALHYELETKLRSGWWPIPITIIESGDITLPQ